MGRYQYGYINPSFLGVPRVGRNQYGYINLAFFPLVGRNLYGYITPPVSGVPKVGRKQHGYITIVCCVNGGFCVGSQPDCMLHRLFIVS